MESDMGKNRNVRNGEKGIGTPGGTQIGTSRARRSRELLRGGMIFLAGLLFCLLFVCRKGLFASDVDWIAQHSVFPDYFRQRFYATGQLFPDFAWNLGGGQNIYDFSYYGLFSPFLLLSYALPFVPMDVYVMACSMLGYAASGMLVYLWLGDKGLEEKVRVLSSLLFLLSTSLLYHSYVQLMFVNYMPFLVLALMGCDRYFAKGKRGCLMAGIIGMVLTSYYFSIGGLLCLCLYAFGKRGFRGKRMFAFGGWVALAIGCCAILLVPTALSLFAGDRSGGGSEAVTTGLLAFKPFRYLYHPYGLGLTALLIFSVLFLCFFGKNGRRRLQAIFFVVLSVVPMVARLLNGGLYEKDKVFLPFLPLMVLMVAQTVQQMLGMGSQQTEKTWNRRRKGMLGIVILVFLVLLASGVAGGSMEKYGVWCIADGILVLIGLAINLRWKKFPILLAYAVVILVGIDYEMNDQAGMVLSREDYEAFQFDEKEDVVKKVLEEHPGLYRTECLGTNQENFVNLNRIFDERHYVSSTYSSIYNQNYMDFRKESFRLNVPLRNGMMQAASDNPLFLRFMGVRFLLHSSNVPVAGYEPVERGEAGTLYENRDVLPLFYGTSRTVGRDWFDDLEFPDNQLALATRVIVEESETTKDGNEVGDQLLRPMRRVELELPVTRQEKLSLTPTGDGYEVKADAKQSIVVSGDYGDCDVMAVSFHVENHKPNKDVYVRLQGQTNKLTSVSHEYANHNEDFYYVVSNPGELEIEFSKGEYAITDWKCFVGTVSELCRENPAQYAFVPEGDGAQGDTLAGTIRFEEDGWFVTSIPYDDAFRIQVDGTAVEARRINCGFLGFPVKAGEHRIRMEYRAPGKELGAWLSLSCIVFWMGSGFWQRRRKKGEAKG